MERFHCCQGLPFLQGCKNHFYLSNCTESSYILISLASFYSHCHPLTMNLEDIICIFMVAWERNINHNFSTRFSHLWSASVKNFFVNNDVRNARSLSVEIVCMLILTPNRVTVERHMYETVGQIILCCKAMLTMAKLQHIFH